MTVEQASIVDPEGSRRPCITGKPSQAGENGRKQPVSEPDSVIDSVIDSTTFRTPEVDEGQEVEADLVVQLLLEALPEDGTDKPSNLDVID